MSILGRRVNQLLIIACIVALTGCGGNNGTDATNAQIVKINGHTMGTTYSIKVVATETDADKLNAVGPNLKSGIDALLKAVNQQMSTYIKDSEISRFNNYKDSEWFDVSPDTAYVFDEALRISRISGGAFDITVGPLIDLWGFGAAENERTIPKDEEITALLTSVGFQKLSVRLSSPALKKENPELHCSLSAIAKGFGVDKTAIFLESQGYNNYMVEIGGEIRTGGGKPKNEPWRVAVAAPDGTSRFQKVMPLQSIAMATSGDYHNYFEKDGVRYSHTIDPVTGRPITHTLVSVTVLHDSCMTADALATAINVLGPEKGYQMAVKENLAVFMIVHENDAFVEKATPRFKEYEK